MKSCFVTIQVEPFCEYFHVAFFVSHRKDFVTLFTSGSKRGNGNKREPVSTILLREVST